MLSLEYFPLPQQRRERQREEPVVLCKSITILLCHLEQDTKQETCENSQDQQHLSQVRMCPLNTRLLFLHICHFDSVNN